MASTVKVVTPLGGFAFELLEDRAPRTCEYFKTSIEEGRLDGATVFRIVGPRNHEPGERHPINVVQLGPRERLHGAHDPVPHESTRETGLKHLRGTVSAARLNLNYLYDSFFVCLRDEPALDFGAGRNPDRQGFAAFGQVVSGFDVLERLMDCAEDSDFLEREIPIVSIEVVEKEPPE